MSYFWEMSYFILFFGQFAFKFGILSSFYHHYPMWEHSLKFCSLASLSIKINFVYIMLQSHFLTFFTAWCPVKYIIVTENKLFSWENFCPFLGRQILFLSYFLGYSVLFSIFWPVLLLDTLKSDLCQGMASLHLI